MTSPIQYVRAPAADFVLPFDLANVHVRGRLVRLKDVSARALLAHALPEPAARIAAEMLTLAALLGSALKLGDRLTVQTKSDGALDLAASDYYGAEEGRIAGLRGYARANDDAVKALGAAPSFAALAGKGSLAITIEPRVAGPGGGQTYQGIVALSPDGIAASAQTYFEQSEQLPTAIGVAAKDDEWERLKLFLETVEPFELVDTALPAEDLLWRLFHEDEVRVLPFEPLAFRCGCSAERISSVLRSYPQAQRAGLADPDGIIRARCEFCGTVHAIAPAELE